MKKKTEEKRRSSQKRLFSPNQSILLTVVITIVFLWLAFPANAMTIREEKRLEERQQVLQAFNSEEEEEAESEEECYQDLGMGLREENEKCEEIYSSSKLIWGEDIRDEKREKRVEGLRGTRRIKY